VSLRASQHAADRRDLGRGAVVNLVGNLFKLADPVLLVAVAVRYGTEAYGLFFVAQAITLLLLRVCLVGMDKALLWWIPRERDRDPTPLFRRAAWISISLATLVTLIVASVASGSLMEQIGRPAAAATGLRLLVLSLPVLAMLELLTHATMGARRMETNMVVKDVVQPIVFPSIALVFAALGLQSTGLGWAYLVSNLAGLAVAYVGYRRQFHGAPEGTASPPGLLRYALPMWAAEVSNSLLQRVDVLLVEALTSNFALVGVWGIVTKLSNSLRAIRRSFDPIVASIAADPDVAHDRLRAVMSRATVMVSALQVPVVAFLFVFVDDVLGWFGGQFDAAGVPLLVLASGWLVASTVGLAGVALYARGHSTLHLANILGTIATVTALGLYAIPRWQLVGAAASVVGGYLAQAVAQAIQLRRRTGVWGFDRTSARPLLAGFVATAAAAGVHLSATGMPDLPARIATFAAFALTYGGVLYTTVLRKR